MQHVVLSIILPSLLDRKPFEVGVMPVIRLHPVQEKFLHGGEQRAFPKALGTSQDQGFSVISQILHEGGLIDITAPQRRSSENV